MTLVFLPGLAADDRMFHSVKSQFPGIYVNWIPPQKGESLNCYAGRLTKNFSKDKEESSMKL